MDYAQVERERGRQREQAAKNEAMGELYCSCCGLKRYGAETCPECGADREKRTECSNSSEYPKSLEDARQEVEE